MELQEQIDNLSQRVAVLEARLVGTGEHPMDRPSTGPTQQEKYGDLWAVFGRTAGPGGRLFTINSDEDLLYENHKRLFQGFVSDESLPLDARMRIARAGRSIGLTDADLQTSLIRYGGRAQVVFPNLSEAYGNVFALRLNVEDLLDDSNKGGNQQQRDEWVAKEMLRQIQRGR